MTSPYLIDDLERDEGFRAAAYPDPLSHGAPWTIGFGHTGREVHPGLVWDRGQALAALQADIMATCSGLDSALPWWRQLGDLRQDCLANQAFNMGVHGLLQFSAYLRLVRVGNYGAAAVDELHTLWARQVGARAQRLARQMATGVHQG
jgi:lysozyme